MKRPWRLRRQTTPSPRGQRRWNQAYHLLLEWTDPPSALTAVHLEALPDAEQEVHDAYGPVWESFDPTASSTADQ
jgi:hypothetical protein